MLIAKRSARRRERAEVAERCCRRGLRFTIHDTAALVGGTRIAEMARQNRGPLGQGVAAYLPQAGSETRTRQSFFEARRPTTSEYEKAADLISQVDRERALRQVWRATGDAARSAAVAAATAGLGLSATEQTSEATAARAQLDATSGMIYTTAHWVVCAAAASLAMLGCRGAAVARPDAEQDLIEVPAGPFMMGCDVANEGRCGEIEGDNPLHEVTLSAYRIDRFEVSQARYRACLEAGTCTTPSCEWTPAQTPQLPVVCVTWAQAQAYCRFRGGRLPTEAEWEKAARGVDRRPYPWGTERPDCRRANAGGCSDHREPVDAHPMGRSPYGAFNMAGNVSEWVADWYAPGSYQSDGAARDPRGPAAGTQRAQRGGSYVRLYVERDDAHVASRNYAEPDAAMPTLGFRCAR